MPLMRGLRKFSWTLKSVAARTDACMSEQPQVGVANGVPAAVLVLVRLGLTAVDALHPRAGATEVATVVGVVDRWVDASGRQAGVLGGGDEVLPGQVGRRVLQQVPQRLGQAPQRPLDVVVLAVVGALERLGGVVQTRRG